MSRNRAAMHTSLVVPCCCSGIGHWAVFEAVRIAFVRVTRPHWVSPPIQLKPSHLDHRSHAEQPESVAVRGLTYRRKVRQFDHELADGLDPDTDRHIRRRARQITGISFRCGLAEKLERLVKEAEDPQPWQSPIRWSEVREFSLLFLALAESLTAPIAVSPQGVARTVILVDDGTSALYGPGGRGSLGATVRAALRSLEVGPFLLCDRPFTPSAAVSRQPMPWGI